MMLSLEWHKESLRNRKEFLNKLILETQNAERAEHRMRADIDFIEKQIAEAERLKKTHFDPEKFLTKRKKHG